MGNTEAFEQIAEKYDTTERIEIAKMISNAIREYITDGKNKSAIDFGCGTGLVGIELINEFKSVLFLDTAQSMLDQITQKIAVSEIKNADILCFDFETGIRSDLHADYIFMAQVLLHIKEIQPVLSRLYEVLNPEGHLLIVDFDKNEAIESDLVHNGFNQTELSERLSEIGYRKIQSKTFYSGEKIFMGKDASLFILDAQKINN
ncbi:MAG: Methyltransferase type 12 [Bacillota bacterium]|jgi:ubiquinone/menaquinone biosynthesis C-methylase UbiE|nr:Methyltransferase type 12 [Bacillota bacterium]